MSKYIDAEKLIALIDAKLEDLGMSGSVWVGRIVLQELKSDITSLQQEWETKFIEINGIRYKEVPAKTDDKICKECDYFLDNGSCNLDDCPCTYGDNILERIQQEQLNVGESEYGPYARQYPKSSQKQPEVDYNKFEELFHDFCEENKGHHMTLHDACMWFWTLGLKAGKEE